MSDEWKKAVEDELVCIGIWSEKHKVPREALNAAIQWNVDVALDPSVSDAAKKLQQCCLIMRQYGRGIFSRAEEPHGLFHGSRAQANAYVKELNAKSSTYLYLVAPAQHIYPEK